MFIAFLPILSVKAQAIEDVSLRDSLCHRWHLVSFEIEGNKIPLSRVQKETYMEFNADSSYIDNTNGNEQKGIWYLNKQRSKIIIDDLKEKNALLYLNLETIQAGKLVLTMQDQNKMLIRLFMESE